MGRLLKGGTRIYVGGQVTVELKDALQQVCHYWDAPMGTVVATLLCRGLQMPLPQYLVDDLSDPVLELLHVDAERSQQPLVALPAQLLPVDEATPATLELLSDSPEKVAVGGRMPPEVKSGIHALARRWGMPMGHAMTVVLSKAVGLPVPEFVRASATPDVLAQIIGVDDPDQDELIPLARQAS